jgi:hypothetical protein
MPRWIAQTALAGATVLSALLIVLVVAKSWGQPPSPAQDEPTKQGGTARPGNDPKGLEAGQTGDGMGVMEAQLEAKRSLLRIDELRAEHAKLWRAYYEKLAREGKVIEDRMLAARDDLLMMEAHVTAERADLQVAEIRAKYARLHAASGDHATAAADQAREELDVLEALLESKRALLKAGESRAAQARRVESHYEKLFRSSMATEDLVLAARDDVLLMDSALAWGRAEVKVAEARVKNARRISAHDGSRADGTARRLAELEERLAASEMKADILQHEVGRLRRELPRETKGAR